jgi:lipopolysaccharide heptosyltransferase I
MGPWSPCFDPSLLRSVLIVKMSSIGDVVHAVPVATALRRRYPRVRISWAVEEWTAPLLRGHPAIDRLVVFPPMRFGATGPTWVRSFVRAARHLRSESYDICLDLQGLLKSAVVALLSRAAARIGVPGQREGAWLVSRPIPSVPGRCHVVEDYLRCAQFLGASATPVSFEIPVQPEATRSIAEKLSAMRLPGDAPLIVINPSASGTWRTWPVQRWSSVATALADIADVVLVGGREQTARHAAVVQHAARHIHDLTGRTTLAELVALLLRCTLHVAPDTGSAHIAAALGRPVVGVYGPTAPWRKAPYGCEALVVYEEGHCGAGCPRLCLRRRRCLQAATPAEVVDRAHQVLAARRAQLQDDPGEDYRTSAPYGRDREDGGNGS